MAAKLKSKLMEESRQRKIDAGLVRREYWATIEQHQELKNIIANQEFFYIGKNADERIQELEKQLADSVPKKKVLLELACSTCVRKAERKMNSQRSFENQLIGEALDVWLSQKTN